jgi:hypothetical protein
MMSRIALAFTILFSFDTSSASWSILPVQETDILNFVQKSVTDGIKNLETVNAPLAAFLSEQVKQIEIKLVVGTMCGTSFCTDAEIQTIYISRHHLANYKARKSQPSYVLWWKNAIFHEFLHLVNLPTGNDIETEHNRFFSKKTGFIDHQMEKDFVFACAAQAFPGQAIYNVKESIGPGKNQGLFNTDLARQTCSQIAIRDGEFEILDEPEFEH